MVVADVLKMFSNLKRHEVELLIAHIIKKDRLWVLTHLECELSTSQQHQITDSLQKLINGEPLSYIVGYKRFYEADFLVNQHVLIPRQETEELVDLVLDHIRGADQALKIADVGTGSGCIAISLAAQAPQHSFYLVDISDEALQVAKKNVVNILTPENLTKIHLLQGSLLDPLRETLPQVIVANLPYLGDMVYQTMDQQVLAFEPRLALYGGIDGLDIYRQLIKEVENYYNSQPFPQMWWEISPEQYDLIVKGAVSIPAGYHIDFYRDLTDRWRFVRLSV